MRIISILFFLMCIGVVYSQQVVSNQWIISPDVSFNGYTVASHPGLFYRFEMGLAVEYSLTSRFMTGIRGGFSGFKNEVRKGNDVQGGAFVRYYIIKGLNVLTGVLLQSQHRNGIIGRIGYGIKVNPNIVVEPGIEYVHFFNQKENENYLMGKIALHFVWPCVEKNE